MICRLAAHTGPTAPGSLDGYRRLVVHFTINDIRHAQLSVDQRMELEMRRGQQAMARRAPHRETVAINAGGPYGSSVLAGVQKAAQKVWASVEADRLASSWHQANIAIEACDGEWTAHAVAPDGARSSAFRFAPVGGGCETKAA